MYFIRHAEEDTMHVPNTAHGAPNHPHRRVPGELSDWALDFAVLMLVVSIIGIALSYGVLLLVI